MQKSRHLLFYRVLVFILFLSIANVSMATTDVAFEAGHDVNGEIQLDHHLNYDGLSSAYTMLLVEGNYELPPVNELKLNSQLFYPSYVSDLSIYSGRLFNTLRKDVHITASLDGLTIIYPFHTFL